MFERNLVKVYIKFIKTSKCDINRATKRKMIGKHIQNVNRIFAGREKKDGNRHRSSLGASSINSDSDFGERLQEFFAKVFFCRLLNA